MTTQTNEYTALLRLEIERNQITAQRITMSGGATRQGMRLAELFRQAAALFQREVERTERISARPRRAR